MKANMKLHDRAVELCREHRRVEFELIEVLQDIEVAKLYRAFGCASLFKYAVDILQMTESIAYAFILVARKAKAVPELQRTLRAQSLSVRKALRTVSILNKENAAEIIEFALAHNSRELDQEIARRQPETLKRNTVRSISAEHVKLNLTLNKRVFDKLKRIQNLMGESDLEKVLEDVFDQFLNKKDPVRKAERGLKEKATPTRANGASPANGPGLAHKSKLEPIRKLSRRTGQQSNFVRKALTARQRHEVHSRDKGRCTYIDAQGRRCENERWLHLHHIRPVSLGGSNSPENIQTLCASHHDLVHQMSFELKSPVTAYRAN